MGYIVKVFKIQIIDNETNEVMATSMLQSAEIQRQLQALDIRTGQGNNRVAYINHSPDTTINLARVDVAYPWLSHQLGQDIVTGAGVAWKFLDSYTVADDTGIPTVTVPEVLATNPNVIAKTADDKPITGFTVTGSKIDFSAASPTVAIGDSVQLTYKYDTDPETQIIEIDDAVFPKGATVILETIEVDGKNKPLNTIQVEFYNCISDGNITISTQAEPQAQSNAMSMKVVNLDGSTKAGEFRRIPITA